jgi:hypothetical protein
MIKELSAGIMGRWNALSYNAAPLVNTCKLTASVGINVLTSEENGYPFAVYQIIGDNVDFTTCSDIHTMVLQFNVYDNLSTLERILGITDAILNGYNMCNLGLTDNLIKIEPMNLISPRFMGMQYGWQTTIEFRVQVEKTR